MRELADRLPPEQLVDSKGGIEVIMTFARLGGFVLNEYHEKIARKYGVSTEGVTFSRTGL